MEKHPRYCGMFGWRRGHNLVLRIFIASYNNSLAIVTNLPGYCRDGIGGAP